MLNKLFISAVVLLSPVVVFGQCYGQQYYDYNYNCDPVVTYGAPVVVQSTGDHYILHNEPSPKREKFYKAARLSNGWKAQVPIINGIAPSVSTKTQNGWRVIVCDYIKRIPYDRNRWYGKEIVYGNSSQLNTHGDSRKAPSPKAPEESNRGGTDDRNLERIPRKAPSVKPYDDDLRGVTPPRQKAPSVRTLDLNPGYGGSEGTKEIESILEETRSDSKNRNSELEKRILDELEKRILDLEKGSKINSKPSVKVPSVKRPDDLLVRPQAAGEPERAISPTYEK